MAYSIDQNPAGRFIVTSPKGKAWKTTYATRQAAEKAVAYIEGRFGEGGSSPATPTPSSSLDQGEDLPPQSMEEADAERVSLGIPPAKRNEPDTQGW